ncbi:MAG: chloride channel protein [Acidimicrobiia bacterium]
MAPSPDPTAVLRSKSFVVILVFAAIVGVLVSLASWGFLELVHQTQVGVFTDLPSGLGFNSVPWWWPLPVLGLAGVPTAFAISRLPGNGGHVPAFGLRLGSTEPNMMPGVALAAFATLALGVVLGPEAPLIALGGGLAVFAAKQAKRDAGPQLLTVLSAAGAFAAISVIFGSPIVAAILVIEATGLGGATLPLILIPGLIAAGIGSLVFLGMAHWTGLSTTAYALVPLHLSALAHPSFTEIGWTIAIGLAAAAVTYPIRRLGIRTATMTPKRPFVILPMVGVVVALLAIVFDHITSKGTSEVLFSGQDALSGLVAHAGTWSLGALALVFVCKGLAWSLSLGSFRGGPTFPAIFLGAAGGIAASHLPGMPPTAAIAVGIGAMFVAFLKLPLSAIVIASVLTAGSGPAAVPLVIVGVVVAYLATLALEGRSQTADADHHGATTTPSGAATIPDPAPG